MKTSPRRLALTGFIFSLLFAATACAGFRENIVVDYSPSEVTKYAYNATAFNDTYSLFITSPDNLNTELSTTVQVTPFAWPTALDANAAAAVVTLDSSSLTFTGPANTQTSTVTIHLPAGTPAGDYVYLIQAVGWPPEIDSTPYHVLRITVTEPAPPPASGSIGFSVEPQAQTAVAGSSVSLSAAAIGTGQLTYRWYLNDSLTNFSGPTMTISHASKSWAGTWKVRVTDDNGALFSAGAILTVLEPQLTAINPGTVTAGSTSATITLTGANFSENAQAYFIVPGYSSLSARPTHFLDVNTLQIELQAADLVSQSGDITVAQILVAGANDLQITDASNWLPLSIISSNVLAVQTNVATASSTTVSTAPTANGLAGVTATLENNSTTPAAITVATYDSNVTPVPVASFDAGAFVDVKVTGAQPGSTVASYFYYPNTITAGAEDALQLQYFDGTSWHPVLSSGGIAPAKEVTDNLDGTVSGGRFAVVFDATSEPTITQLTGTVLTMAIHDVVAPVVRKVEASRSTLWPVNGAMISVSFMIDAIDNVDRRPRSRVISVASNEPAAKTASDCQITGPLTVNLRAARAGKSGDRVYTIVIETSDFSGNKTLTSTSVIVPHDQR